MSSWDIRETISGISKEKDVAISPRNVSFYIELLRYTKENGLTDENGRRYITLTMKKMADLAGCPLARIKPFLNTLEALGLIYCERQKKDYSQPEKRELRGRYPNKTYFLDFNKE